MLGWLYENKVLSRIETNRRPADRLFPRGLYKAAKRLSRRLAEIKTNTKATLRPQAKELYKTSRRITKFLRKVFEYRRIKQVLGVNLLSAVVLLSQISVPASALQAYPQAELVVLTPVEAETKSIETETKVGFQTPLKSFQISQGYHMFHLAIDLAAPIGSPVKPIAQGAIERVEYGRWGYGNSILINHGSGLKSFYAHMGRIKVKKGDEVDIEDLIGTVGISGWATGPHLHLEIWQNDRPLNPRMVLDLSPNANLASIKQ